MRPSSTADRSIAGSALDGASVWACRRFECSTLCGIAARCRCTSFIVGVAEDMLRAKRVVTSRLRHPARVISLQCGVPSARIPIALRSPARWAIATPAATSSDIRLRSR